MFITIVQSNIKNFFPLSCLVVASHCMVVYKCKTSKCMIKQIRSNFVYKKCFINVSIELPCRTWIFLKMVTKPKLTNIIKILHFLWKQIVLRFLMQFYKVFQSEEELEQIRAYLVFYDHRHLTLYTFQKKYIYTCIYLLL